MNLVLGFILGILVSFLVLYYYYKKGVKSSKDLTTDVKIVISRFPLKTGLEGAKKICRDTQGELAFQIYDVLDCVQSKYEEIV